MLFCVFLNKSLLVNYSVRLDSLSKALAKGSYRSIASQCIKGCINSHRTENATVPILNLNTLWCCFYSSSSDKLLKVLVNKRSLCSNFFSLFFNVRKIPRAVAKSSANVIIWNGRE